MTQLTMLSADDPRVIAARATLARLDAADDPVDAWVRGASAVKRVVLDGWRVAAQQVETDPDTHIPCGWRTAARRAAEARR